MEGIYAMYYTGKDRASHAVFILKDGFVSGADAMGGVLDGIYAVTEDGEIEVSAMLKYVSGTWLATGGTVEEKDGLVQEITARLPRNFGNGNSIGIQNSTGSINAIFKKLRDVL